MFYIWVRATVDWEDEEAFLAQVRPEFDGKLVLWNATFTIPYHLFRHRVRRIADLIGDHEHPALHRSPDGPDDELAWKGLERGPGEKTPSPVQLGNGAAVLRCELPAVPFVQQGALPECAAAPHLVRVLAAAKRALLSQAVERFAGPPPPPPPEAVSRREPLGEGRRSHLVSHRIRDGRIGA